MTNKPRWRPIETARQDGTPADPTAETEPLTTGQQIAAIFDADLFAEPCDLAEAIDRAIWEAAEVTSPVREWRCFHCDEVFTDRACAAVHFGDADGATPACRVAADLVGLVEMIRKQESKLDAFRREETASYREFYALGAAHHQAVRKAEEAGYAKALADLEAGKLEPEHAGRILAAIDEAATLERTKMFPGTYQQRVNDWMLKCFGPSITEDKTERNHRFLEEALELVQSGGCTASEAHQLVAYVFSRPVGEIGQEVGGSIVTLAAFCNAHGVDLDAEAEKELTRVWGMMDQIRAKQAAKPKHSPLPE